MAIDRVMPKLPAAHDHDVLLLEPRTPLPAAPAEPAAPATPATPAETTVCQQQHPHFPSLDGWRAIAIVLVLLTHLMPLGPQRWELNTSAGLAGMALFFCLSGFLVTNLLIDADNLGVFLVRRFFRIVPLAWLCLLIAFVLNPVAPQVWLPHFLFYANYPPKPLIAMTDHLWSLCVEVQFYLGIALVIVLCKRRGLVLLPLACVLVTGLRVWQGAYFSVITYLRVDEILVGGMLALVNRQVMVGTHHAAAIKRCICAVPFALVLAAFLVSCSPLAKACDYARPYLAMLLVGSTLFAARNGRFAILDNKPLGYLATISFALYMIHPLLSHSWLGSGDLLEKYLKRPLLLLVLFVLAHLSTFHFERYAIRLGKRLCGHFSGVSKPAARP